MELRQRNYLQEVSGMLLGTSGSLAGIKQVITKFYAGSKVVLKQLADKEWEVSTGAGVQGRVHVVKKGKRFVFKAK